MTAARSLRRCVFDPICPGVTCNVMAKSRTAKIPAARFRDRQRAKGLRPATIWIPDIRDPAYRAGLDAACREVAALPAAEAEADAAAGSRTPLSTCRDGSRAGTAPAWHGGSGAPSR